VIAVGLVAAAKLPNIAGVIVMDGDGEDRPEDIRVLLQEAARQPSHIDCARRRKRSESLLFASRTASTKRSFSPATCISAMDQHRKAGSDVHYAGSELTLFSAAVNWKSYVAHMIGPYIHGRVLEVGAGLGINIPHLLSASVIHWLAMEPDPDLAAVIEQKIRKRELPPSCQVINGTLDAVGLPERFDTILYLDVLEHIADDAAELRHAARHLAPNGTLIVLAPPHRFLFSAFDQAIGHYRRYTNGPNE
jgi:SAM-dependent methyltransferase